MPRIEAESVKVHRQQMMDKLVDAAEAIIRTQGVSALTAKAVTAQTGIARNSIYRYVESVDELRALVVARYLPTWLETVEDAVAGATDPKARIMAYAHTNLDMAKRYGHGWLMGLTRGLNPEMLAHIIGAHHTLHALLSEQCVVLDPEEAVMTAAFIQGIVEAGFTRLDAGDDDSMVHRRCEGAIQAILDALSSAPSGPIPPSRS